MYSKNIQNLIDLFSRFPGIGPKAATRLVFYLTKNNNAQELGTALLEFHKSLKTCPSCFKFHETNEKLCEICLDNSRNKSLLCIVEKETDLESIEKTHLYKGLYFILGSIVPDLKQETLKKLRIRELKQKIGSSQELKEIILGLNPTSEGEAIALYLERELKGLNKKITRLARGLPVGGELEYADRETLKSALERRK